MRMEPGFFFLQQSKSDKSDSCDAIGSGEADIYNNNGGVTKNDLYGWSTDVNSSFEQFLSRCVYIKTLWMGLSPILLQIVINNSL